MFTTLFRRLYAIPGLSVRRFPLALLVSLMALASAIALYRQKAWGIPDDWLGSLVRILLLWPFALFGNVAWVMVRERDGRPVLRGLAIGAFLLFAAYWLMPPHPQHETLGFWFRYFLLGAALLVATAGFPARRSGHPDLWDSAWPVGLAAFMATLSAMLVVGGISLALVSVDKLFTVDISEKLYFDLFLTGFFLLAPITAFAWLPSPLGQQQPQPAWLKGTARVVLMPLCLLYALILIAYLGKIALATEWPDGWVAMPTLIFGTLGLTAYFIARPARDRHAERWATRYCRIFPWILLPLTAVLILAMRVRVAAYGFTEWRVIGLAAGLWFLWFAGVYSFRPRLSSWWITASLALCCVLLGIGPLSAARVSLNSQRARLDTLLTDAGVQEGGPVTIEGDAARRIRSGLDYLLEHHGFDGLPGWVQERWTAHQEGEEAAPEAKRRYWHTRHHALQVLRALEVTLVDETRPAWFRVRCELVDMQLTEFHDLTLGITGQTNQLPFRIDQELRVFAGDEEIATAEREAFVAALMHALDDQPPGIVALPVERMKLAFSHAGEDYNIIFPELSMNNRRGTDPHLSIRQYRSPFLAFRRVEERPPNPD